MNGISSELCSMLAFAISDMESSGSVTIELN
jgi:hypothetical protein